MVLSMNEKSQQIIATNLSANLLNNRLKKIVFLCTLKNSMTKLCSSLFQCENNTYNF